MTQESIERMIESQHPLGMLVQDRQRQFRCLLTPEERETYARAVKYWREVYR